MGSSWLLDIAKANRRGERKGICAEQSQLPTVIEKVLWMERGHK